MKGLVQQMQIETQELKSNEQPFLVTAYWLDPIADFETPVKQPVMIICPGGGFTFHSERETTPIALKFLAEGMHVLVLPYQLRDATHEVYPMALNQVARTIEWVTEQTGKHSIDTDRIVLTGFSAGGHVVANYNGIATNPLLVKQYHLDQYTGQHAAIILAYPVIDLDAGFPTTSAEKNLITQDSQFWHAQTNVTDNAKPAFVWQTATDELVPAENSLRYVLALQKHHIPVEYHLFGSGIHGLALANHVTQKPGKTKYLNKGASQWISLATNWLTQIQVIHNN